MHIESYIVHQPVRLRTESSSVENIIYSTEESTSNF